jgi:hypothetical protein
MSWYDVGSVSVTNGSTTVTGSGTNFIAGAQIGEAFYGPDDNLYEIQAIVSATSLTLADPYLGSTQSGQAYKIIPTQSLVATLASQVSTLISDFQSVADEAGEGKFDDGSAASPGITFNLDQDTGLSRPAANQIGVSTAGVQRLLLTSTALTSTVGFSGTTGTFSGDVTITDKIVHSGDTNTSIRFPAADTVTVETAGAERMRITSTGNVGIGTSSPVTNLEVHRGSEGEYLRIGGDDALNARGLAFSSSTAGAFVGALHTINARSSVGVLAFATASTERMRITSTGNVGIGTSSPNTASIVDAQSTTKGVRFPNMTTTQKNAIANVAGNVVFDTTLGKLCVNSGSGWETITSV